MRITSQLKKNCTGGKKTISFLCSAFSTCLSLRWMTQPTPAQDHPLPSSYMLDPVSCPLCKDMATNLTSPPPASSIALLVLFHQYVNMA